VSTKKLALLALIAACPILFFSLDLGQHLSFESLKANREALIAFHASHRLATVLTFMALYILQTALSLPGATVFSLAAGLLFGAALGTVYAVIAATIGAVLAFGLSRYLVRDLVQQRFGTRLAKVNEALEKEGLSYLLFLRLVPLFPFFLVNLAAAMTRLPLRTFALGTLIGILPGGFIYVNAGASIATINSLGDIASPKVVGSFALLGVFALLPGLFQALKTRTTTEEGSKV